MANIDNGVMLGALGSAYTRTGTTIVPPTGMVIAALQPLSEMSFSTLTTELPTKFYNTSTTIAHSKDAGSETVDEGSGGTSIIGALIPAGMVIYGRWTAAAVNANAKQGYIAYFGY
tara:strand:+ start:20 stop:367 length:348 start_codon:yes stop_codon:yes gene_type:complete